jgi:hypothetical protein
MYKATTTKSNLEFLFRFRVKNKQKFYTMNLLSEMKKNIFFGFFMKTLTHSSLFQFLNFSFHLFVFQ